MPDENTWFRVCVSSGRSCAEPPARWNRRGTRGKARCTESCAGGLTSPTHTQKPFLTKAGVTSRQYHMKTEKKVKRVRDWQCEDCHVYMQGYSKNLAVAQSQQHKRLVHLMISFLYVDWVKRSRKNTVFTVTAATSLWKTNVIDRTTSHWCLESKEESTRCYLGCTVHVIFNPAVAALNPKPLMSGIQFYEEQERLLIINNKD